METRKTRHSTYQIAYHIVWCTKYRNKVIKGQYEAALVRELLAACNTYGWDVEELNTMPDHVHLMVSADPSTAPVEIAKTLKSITAAKIFAEFPDLKKKRFWGSGLWSNSTFYGTVGIASENVIRKYIQDQKRK